MIIAFDTTFLILHYFSNDEDALSRTREMLRASRRLGNKGIVPTIVLAEFYAQTYKRAGREIADKYFREIVESGLDIVSLTEPISHRAGFLRAKYQEKISWGDCVLAATAIISKAKSIVTEDPHLANMRDVEARRLSQVRI